MTDAEDTPRKSTRKRYVAGEIPAEVIAMLKDPRFTTLPEEYAHVHADLNIDWSKEGLVHYGTEPAPEDEQ